MFTSIYPQPSLLSASKTRNDVRYPQDIQVIIRSDRVAQGNLYISNLQAAQNQEILESLQINAILCVAKGFASKLPKEIVKHSKYIPVEQGQNAQFIQYLDEGVNFIAEKLIQTNVLVHCVSGASRSACFVVAYLMKHRKLSLQDAYIEVKSRRKIISLSDKVISQLKRYEQEIMNKGNTKGKLSSFQRSGTLQDKSVRLKTNNMLDKSNILQKSNYLNKSNIEDDSKNYNKSKLSVKINMEDLEDKKSYRSHRSCNNKSQSKINIQILKPRNQKNPEESFISKKTKILAELDKSFSSYNHSIKNNTQMQQIDDMPELTMPRKAISSKDEFIKKINYLDSKNREINEKISFIHSKFQDESKTHKIDLQSQLTQINEIRSNLQSLYNERKSKLSDRTRNLHDKTMEDKEVRQYMQSGLPMNTIKKSIL